MAEKNEFEFNSELESLTLILRNSIHEGEITNLHPSPLSLAVGQSGNNAMEYSALVGKEKKPLHMFIKRFFIDDLWGYEDQVMRECKCSEILEEALPGSTYKVIASSEEENPLIITKKIEGAIPLSVEMIGSTDDLSRLNAVRGALFLLKTLHDKGAIHHDAQAKNFLVVPLDRIIDLQNEDPRNGVKIIDFEEAVFKDEVEEPEFRRLMAWDIQIFFNSMLKQGVFHRNPDHINSLRKFYFENKPELRKTITQLYKDIHNSDEFVDALFEDIDGSANEPIQ